MTSVAPHHPAVGLLARYGAVFRAAWAMRRELAGPKRLTDELAFLPAALSLQDTPAHPTPRRTAIAICALFVIAIAWAYIGQVDIVAVAAGRIVVSERTKTLQPLEASVVKRVLVKDGDSVQAGQVLVELDATIAQADGTNVQEQLNAAVIDEERAIALMAALKTGKAPVLSAALSADVTPKPTGAPSAATQLHAEWLDISARLARLRAEQLRREAEIATVRELIAKLEATLPIAQQREADIKGLAEQGFVAGHAGQDRTRERIEQERDLATQRARLAEAQAALNESVNSRSSFIAETQRTLSDRQAQANLKRQQLTQERSKAEQRSRLTLLTAPTSGTVQQVAVHTEGGVVTPAQVLMVIVPRDAQVTAEVVIDNKDIGFVNAGQSAEIKLETFPFTRYGTVPAIVKSVTADAVNDEKRGAIFPAVLTLAQTSIAVDGKRITLSPGMNVTAEIKTGKRRVIEYLLSPVQRALSESLGER
ncbi:MAG: HlyD family type I secretion periplasmic adaptor subunit [Burkholderiaceae bacterium]